MLSDVIDLAALPLTVHAFLRWCLVHLPMDTAEVARHIGASARHAWRVKDAGR